jgi:outer membrane protein assembly factor BamB
MSITLEKIDISNNETIIENVFDKIDRNSELIEVQVNSISDDITSLKTGSSIKTELDMSISTAETKISQLDTSVINASGTYADVTTRLDANDTQISNITQKISDISLDSEILWKIQSTGKEAIFSTPILKTLSTGVKALIYSSWDWYIYCRNADTGALIWRYATGAPCYGRCQAEDINGDGKIEIFGASHDGYIYCLSESGVLLWSFQNAYGREGTGTIATTTTTYITDTTKSWQSGEFTRGTKTFNSSLEVTSGTMIGQKFEIQSAVGTKITFWDILTTAIPVGSTYKINPKYASDINYQHAGTLSKESNVWYLYTTGFDGQCVKINASTGVKVWVFSSYENIEPFPTILDINGDGTLEVLINCLDKHVYCLKATDGSVVWSTSFTEGNDSFLSVKDIDNDGTLEVLVSSRDNRIYILNGNTGVIKNYTKDVGGDVDCRPLVDASLDGFVCGSDTGYICGYDKTGETLWTYKAMDSTNTSMILGVLNGNNILIQGDQNGGLHFLDTNGNLIKRMCLRGGIEGTPYLESGTNYFTLYVTTIEGWVYAIKINETLASIVSHTKAYQNSFLSTNWTLIPSSDADYISGLTLYKLTISHTLNTTVIKNYYCYDTSNEKIYCVVEPIDTTHVKIISSEIFDGTIVLS